jgi:hypothetical protein
MFYIAKLARRLARLRLGEAGVHLGSMITLLLLAACAAGEPTSGLNSSSGQASEDGPVIVAPRSVLLEDHQSVRFLAYESLLPGSSEITAIEWTATGGSIGTDGSYTPGPVGEFKVIGKKKGWANRPPSDTASVIVVPPQPEVIAVYATPEDASVPGYGRVQFEALGQLSDGTAAPVGVSWSATGGSIDAGGLYTAGNVAGTYKVIALHTTTGNADTVPVIVTSSLQSLRLDPASTSLSAGGGQQFKATGVMTDGSTATVSGVTYSATGGTISSGGFFNAPSTAGSYTVTAKLTTILGSVLTTQATVAVTGSSTSTTSSPGYPNQPSGFTRIAENRFSGSTIAEGAIAGEWGGPWYGTGNFQTLVSDASAPNGTGKVAATTWPGGLVAGNSPVMFNGWDRRSNGFTENGRYRKLYLSMRVKIPQADYENQNTGTKLWYLAHGNLKQQNADYLYIEGTYNGTSIMDRMKVAISISPADEAITPGSRPYRQNVDTRALLTAGSWHHVEVYMDQGTVGNSDGTLRVWVDGVRVTDYTRQVKFLDAAYDFTQGFYDFQWTPVWGGTGGAKTRNDRMYLASIYISGAN